MKHSSCNTGRRGSKCWVISNHDLVIVILFCGLGKFIPDVHPVSVLVINLLSTNFNVDFLNNNKTNVMSPSCSTSRGCKGWKINFKIHLPDQITISRNDSICLLSEIGLSRKGNL